MQTRLTTHQVIDISAELYDIKGYTREQIRVFLQALLDSGCVNFDMERMFDLIVG